MRLLLYTDPHLCTNSSIIVGKMDHQELDRFSARLDRCISTFKWINNLAKDKNADKIICLGDLVDQPKLTAEELSAISESNLYEHEILVGNHDVSSSDGYFNSCNLYGNAIREPKVVNVLGTNIVYLPWSRDRIDLLDYLKELNPDKTIVLSHNDIKGIYYGSYLSKDGYDIDEILRSCRLFINGHLHVGKWIVDNRIMNLGTVTGLNFNNIGGWVGKAIIVDTETFDIEWYDNPYTFYFYDKKILSRIQLTEFFRSLDHSKCNIVQLRLPKPMVELGRSMINEYPSIAFSRVLTLYEVVADGDQTLTGQDEKLDQIPNQGISIYDTLREFINSKCPPKYDKADILKEVDILEGMV